ncbi:ABC transporter substrate-binding protein [Rhizobium sp. BK176]|uniref:ABC transporter substrate-binding protein n=1 Tax=Rhizobium sp. BK176 TaxID=2587071 RepID=UPI00216965A7|nr:ABC transporter substrate-binding protein [Rhizobium sp. BK176]MCS4093715.1 NitT/TauT family transport system substrate-binding protein [Rhizobium sp. BK176]
MKSTLLKTAALAVLMAGAQLTSALAEELTPVRFVFNWSSADHAIIPVVAGIEKGFYKDEGLKVDVILPPDSQTTARLLSVGQADIGFEATTDVVFGAEQGLPIVSVGVYAQHNNWGLFGRPGERVTLEDLKGKSIGIFTDSWTKAMMPFVYKAAGITENDVKLIIAHDSDTPLLLAGKIDIATNTSNYLVPTVQTQLQKDPTALVGKEAGVPDIPIWAYTASTDYLAKHGDIASKWMKATVKATQWAAENPDEAAKIVTKVYPDSGTLEYNTLGWKALVPILRGPDGFLVQTDQHWLPLAQALKDTGQLKEVLPANKYYTNEFLK